MVEEVKYPLNFGSCPNCGSVRRVANEVLEGEKKKGRMAKGTHAFLFNHQSAIAGPIGTWLSAPVVSSFYDVCVDCGTVYCIHAVLGTAMQGGKMPKKPPQFGDN